MAKSTGSRGLRDEMNVGPDPRSAHHLVPLNDLGKFKIADGEPDVRGWAAYTSTGRELGRVHELLVDTDSHEVVMLDIDLRRDDRHTMVPIRASWVDQSTKRVVVDVAALTSGDEIAAVGRAAPLGDGTANELAANDVAVNDVAVNGIDDRRLAVPPADSDASRPLEDPGVVARTTRDPRILGERVVERRPIVEEVVVRRRDARTTDARATDARATDADAAPESAPDSLFAPRPDDASGPPR